MKRKYKDNVVNTLLCSWRPSTQKQYLVYHEKWSRFCKVKKINEFHRDTSRILEFLQTMVDDKYSYSAINTARSALSALFNSPPIGEHAAVKRFMKGVYNLNPPLPRYSKVWDVSIVLNYLECFSPGKCLNLLQLSQKLATLIALVTSQRCQSLQALDTEHMEINDLHAKFHIQKLLKHNSHTNKVLNVITLPAYKVNKKLCPVTYLKQYLKRTQRLRTDTQLFIGTQKPHKPVSTSTISRWIKFILKVAGINTDIYKAHSCRAASSSAAALSLDIHHILQAGSWTRANTFATFYNKPIEETSTRFGLTVLRKK